MTNDTARLSRIEDKLDALADTVASGFGELKGIPQRVHVLETGFTRIDTTLTAVIGQTTRQELRTDGIETRLVKVEQTQAINLPRFEMLLKDVPEVGKRVGGLERNQTLVEGGWWLAVKIVGALGGAGGLGAFMVWWMERAR